LVPTAISGGGATERILSVTKGMEFDLRSILPAQTGTAAIASLAAGAMHCSWFAFVVQFRSISIPPRRQQRVEGFAHRPGGSNTFILLMPFRRVWKLIGMGCCPPIG
jgi:hypothetical protein